MKKEFETHHPYYAASAGDGGHSINEIDDAGVASRRARYSGVRG